MFGRRLSFCHICCERTTQGDVRDPVLGAAREPTLTFSTHVSWRCRTDVAAYAKLIRVLESTQREVFQQRQQWCFAELVRGGLVQSLARGDFGCDAEAGPSVWVHIQCN